MTYIDKARQVLEIERDGIRRISEQLDGRFDQLVEACLDTLAKRGKIVLSGVGKSGQISQKLASTLSSTGSRACFLHPVEAMHGDLGVLGDDDLFIALSYSGETEELLQVIPAVRRLGIRIAALTGNDDSSLASLADVAVSCRIEQEACPFNLAPTTTTTAMLALGDALAMVLMQERNFQIENYGMLHPSGAIGRSVTLKIKDLMRTGERLCVVSPETTVLAAVLAMCSTKGGTALVACDDRILRGIFTTGDLKRVVARSPDALHWPVSDAMVKDPVTIHPEAMAVEIMKILRVKAINSVPVVDGDRRVCGVVDIQDLPKFKVM